MGTKLVEKRNLSAKGLLAKARDRFRKVSEPTAKGQGGERKITIVDCCMSALAMFKLKFPSMLQFDTHKEEEPVKTNIKNLFS